MGQLGWTILVQVLSYLATAAWLFVGLQFHQVAGPPVAVGRTTHVVYGVSSLAFYAVAILVIQSIIPGLATILGPLPIFVAVLVGGRLIYRRSAAQLLKVGILLICQTGLLALLQVLVSTQLGGLTDDLNKYLVIRFVADFFFIVLSGGIIRKAASPAFWQAGAFPWKTVPQIACLLVMAYLLLSAEQFFFYFVRGGFAMYVLGWISILVMGLFAVDLYDVQARHAGTRQELAMYKKQAEIQYAYYLQLEQKYNDSRKLIHDIRNHLHAIEGLHAGGDAGAAAEYTVGIHDMLNRMGQKYYCDHRMLNIILSDKMDAAQRQGIHTVTRISEINLNWMDNVDVTTLFANLLDNAVTAASAFPNAPWLSVTVKEIHEFLLIEVKNAALPKNSYEGGSTRRVGIGLKNVGSVVERYHGTLNIEREDEVFKVSIVLPLPASAPL